MSILIAVFIGGVLSSLTPCGLAAVPIVVGLVGGGARTMREAVVLSAAFVGGMLITFVMMGMAVARLGMLFGLPGGPWIGAVLVLIGLWMFFRSSSACSLPFPIAWQARFRGSGWIGATVLGALVGSVMSPCATPPLIAALSLAGTGSVLWGGAVLLAYGLGHSVLLFAAGVVPQQIAARVYWLPGQRFFAVVLMLAGAWLLCGI